MTWIFAYGSLMGDNAMRFYRGTPARLTGYHRSFNHSSTKRWGTPTHPSPILGLSSGGECEGVAFEIPKSDEKDVVRKIERREGQAEFARKKVRIDLRDGTRATALVWVTKPAVQAAPPWSVENGALGDAFRAAHGTVGTGVEYVRTLIHAMERWQITDPTIESLWQALKPHSIPRG